MNSDDVVWIDEHPCTANALQREALTAGSHGVKRRGLRLIDRLSKLGRLGGAKPIRVNAPTLAALTGETIGAVLSDDESLLGQNK